MLLRLALPVQDAPIPHGVEEVVSSTANHFNRRTPLLAHMRLTCLSTVPFRGKELANRERSHCDSKKHKKIQCHFTYYLPYCTWFQLVYHRAEQCSAKTFSCAHAVHAALNHKSDHLGFWQILLF